MSTPLVPSDSPRVTHVTHAHHATRSTTLPFKHGSTSNVPVAAPPLPCANGSGSVSVKSEQAAISSSYGPYRAASPKASAFALLRKRSREAELSAEETLAAMEDLDELTSKPGFICSETLIGQIINKNVWPPGVTSPATILHAAAFAAAYNAEDSDYNSD